ncbi:ankyrin-1, partial [Dactylonectria estremocensis]
MEPVGLAVGIAGLAGLFSSCLEVVENVDSYRDFEHDSRSLAAQFDADRLRFQQWGRSIGIEEGQLAKQSKLLWITGPAGFGKTILCASVVEHLLTAPKSPVAYFFLSSSFESRSDPYSAMRSWIAQLISFNRTAFDLARGKWLTQDEQVATRTTVIALFQDIIHHVPDCTLVLDGLDECTWIGEDREGHKSMTGFIEAMEQAISDTTTRLMIVSRDEPELRRALTRVRGFLELKISSQDVQHDVLLFSRSIVDRKLPKKDEVTKTEVSLKMADRSEGQFIWVRMQENSLRSWKNKRQLEDAIDKAPAQLESVYERNWTRMSQLPDEERTRAYNLLRWAAFALRPLSVGEMTEAVLIDTELDQLPVEELPDSVDEEYIDNEILGPCGSLLEVREISSETCDPSRTVHLAHFSIKQYFLTHTSTRGRLLLSNHNFQCSNDALENARLASLCLSYVNYRGVWKDSPAIEEKQ